MLMYTHSLCARVYPELVAGEAPMLLQPGIPGPGGLKLRSEGNWKGRETGTRPPSIPKPRGREGGTEPKRLLPEAEDTCGKEGA